jgi:branched-chain amino acid transport system substrate-binding protein
MSPADLIEGVLFIVANWEMKGQDRISDLYKKQSGEPWITQDGRPVTAIPGSSRRRLSARASADRVKVNPGNPQAGPQDRTRRRRIPGRRKFDDGHRVGAPVVIVQWQNGRRSRSIRSTVRLRRRNGQRTEAVSGLGAA